MELKIRKGRRLMFNLRLARTRSKPRSSRQKIIGALMLERNIGRRAFLRGAALAGAAPAVQAAQAGLKWDQEADVVVIGSGAGQVQDLRGQVIPGLYCAGEAADGFGEHGIARCVVGGLIAGRHAAALQVLF
jgi:hypothetical protein